MNGLPTSPNEDEQDLEFKKQKSPLQTPSTMVVFKKKGVWWKTNSCPPKFNELLKFICKNFSKELLINSPSDLFTTNENSKFRIVAEIEHKRWAVSNDKDLENLFALDAVKKRNAVKLKILKK